MPLGYAGKVLRGVCIGKTLAVHYMYYAIPMLSQLEVACVATINIANQFLSLSVPPSALDSLSLTCNPVTATTPLHVHPARGHRRDGHASAQLQQSG